MGKRAVCSEVLGGGKKGGEMAGKEVLTRLTSFFILSRGLCCQTAREEFKDDQYSFIYPTNYHPSGSYCCVLVIQRRQSLFSSNFIVHFCLCSFACLIASDWPPPPFFLSIPGFLNFSTIDIWAG